MEPQKRHHPHTRKEWDEIRATFTDLYQGQKKKLSEIVEILGSQGFHARECHYKTYIRKWGLDKKNKQSDMVFAFQKLLQRQGKDTAFLIRGQTRSRKDIEHYWKRRRLDPASLSPVPNTPDGVEYRTPSPSPAQNTGQAEAGGAGHEEADSSPSAEDEDVAAVFQYINQTSTGLRLLGSPEQLRPLDQALHYAKVLFQRHVEDSNSDPYRLSRREATAAISSLKREAYNALAAIEYRLSDTNITALLLNTLAKIPQMAKYDCGLVAPILLDVITIYAISGQKLKSKMMKVAMHEIMNRTIIVYGVAHPVPLILRAAIQSPDDIHTTSEIFLVAGKDILKRGLGHDHLDSEWLLFLLWQFRVTSDKWNAGLKYAIELHRLTLRRHQRDMTEDTLISLGYSKTRIAHSHFRLDNLEESERWIEDGLQTCSQIKDAASREIYQTQMLYVIGLKMLRSGRWSAAYETFGKVVEMRTKWRGPAEAYVLGAVHYMIQIQQLQDEEAQRFSAAEGGYQNERTEGSRIAHQDESGIDRQSDSWGDEGPSHYRVEPAQHSNAGGLDMWTTNWSNNLGQPGTSKN